MRTSSTRSRAACDFGVSELTTSSCCAAGRLSAGLPGPVAAACPSVWTPVLASTRTTPSSPERGPRTTRERGLVHGAVDDDVQGGGVVALEVLPERGRDLAALGVLGQHAFVRGAEGDAQQRARRGEQHREDGQRGERGAPHDGAGQPAPAGRGGSGAPRLRPRHPPAVDAAPQHVQQGRHHEQARQGRDDDDTDSGVAERAEEVLREDHQRRERGRHGRGGEGDRAPRGAHRRADGVLHARPRRELFAEPADHQQGVVDAESQAEGRGQVDREDGDVRDAADEEELREHAHDGDERDQQRQQRGDHGAEDDQEQHQDEGYGDGLGQYEVLLGLRPPSRG